MRNPGQLVELGDGRKGIAYNKEQKHPDKLMIRIVDEDFQPVMSEKTGQQAMVFKLPSECKLIGFID